MLLWALFELSASRWFPASSAVYLDARSLAKIFPSPRARTYIASRVPSATTESRTTRSTLRGSAAFRAATRRAARSVNDKATNCHAFSTRLDRDLVQWGKQNKKFVFFSRSKPLLSLVDPCLALGAWRFILHHANPRLDIAVPIGAGTRPCSPPPTHAAITLDVTEDALPRSEDGARGQRQRLRAAHQAAPDR